MDEAQDVGVAELRFLAALAVDRPEGLFFAGDLGQRIFQPPFSWKTLGVDVRGRSSTLKINYRTSHQIRSQADRLLPGELADADGNAERREGTVSAFNGPSPDVVVCDSAEDEVVATGRWLAERTREGVSPAEIGIFVRTPEQFGRAESAAERAGLSVRCGSDDAEPIEGKASVLTMHLAKGLEFRAVLVMACDDEVLPLQERIETVADDSDLEEVYNTERNLLYVACTRARDRLMVSGVSPASEFLDDLTEARRVPSDRDPLHDVPTDLPVPAVVKPGRPRVGVAGEPLPPSPRMPVQRDALFQQVGDDGHPEAVRREPLRQPGVPHPPLDHPGQRRSR